MNPKLKDNLPEYKRSVMRSIDPEILSSSISGANWTQIITKSNAHFFDWTLIKKISLSLKTEDLVSMYLMFCSSLIYRVAEERCNLFMRRETIFLKNSKNKLADEIFHRLDDISDNINSLYSAIHTKYYNNAFEYGGPKGVNSLDQFFLRENFERGNKAIDDFFYGDLSISREDIELYPMQSYLAESKWYMTADEVNESFKSIKRGKGYMQKRYDLVSEAMSFGNINEETANLIHNNLSKGFRKMLMKDALEKMDLVRSIGVMKPSCKLNFSSEEALNVYLDGTCYVSADQFKKLLPIYRMIAISSLEGLDYWDVSIFNESMRKEDIPYVMPAVSLMSSYAKTRIMEHIKRLLAS